ncbi:MAG: hypothetical protein PHP41_02385 [Bacilli bacterium]|nr:hypothetical protein [Bacilli bacterium]
MYRIDKDKFAHKVIFLMISLLFIFLISLSYFLGFEINSESILIYVFSILVVILVFYILYKIFRKFSKGYYLISEKKIVEYNNDILIKEIETKAITEVFYIKPLWILMLQMGACFLNIVYAEENQKKVYHISMSQKDVIKIEKLIRISIQIR